MKLQPEIGGSKHLGKGKAAPVPCVDGVVLQAQGCSPIPQIHCAPVKFNNWYCLAGVVPLLFCSGPAAVFRAVVLATVNSVNRQITGAFPHIGQEILKRLPSFTHLDSFGCVRLGLLSVNQPAARNHPSPDVVSAGARHAVFPGAHSARFGLQTPAGLNVAGAEPRGDCLNLIAAIAEAFPPICAIDKTDVRLHNQPVEPIASPRWGFLHVLAQINVNYRIVIDVLRTRAPKYAGVLL